MDTNESVLEYIEAAKASGASDEFLVAFLRQNGWSERSAYQAFEQYYERRLGRLVPRRGPRAQYAGEAFVYLLAFITLGFWTVALGQLFYALIDHAYDTTHSYYAGMALRSEVTWQLATLIVAFPLFLWISRRIRMSLQDAPDATESGVRRWLTYVALVMTACTLLGDAILFLQAFLHGDLAVPFVLKALVVLALAGGIFGYYLLEVQARGSVSMRDRAFGSVAVLAVFVGLAFGFFYTGSPTDERAISNDQTRIADLRALASDLHDVRPSLPPTLAQLPKSMDGDNERRDPETRAPYGYAPGKNGNYELCATFETDERTRNDAFAHPKGHKCFDFNADRDAY